MVRRYRRRRTVRRRRTMRRRGYRRRSAVSRYDGQYRSKIFLTYDLKAEAGDGLGQANLTISWGSTGGGLSATVHPQNSQEFNDFALVFREWKILGMSARVIPVCQVTAALASGLFEVQSGSDPGGWFDRITADSTLKESVDFRTSTLSRPTKRYWNLGKFWSRRAQLWRSTADDYPPASTLFRTETTGYGVNDVVAKVNVTYYVAFRGHR